MKTIDVKSMLIGFLLCAVGFLTIGATNSNNEYGRYQVTGYGDDAGDIYLINTKTGQSWFRQHVNGVGYWAQDCKPNDFNTYRKK